MLYQQKEEFERQKAFLIAEARRVQKTALSYRNFKVGCAVLAWSEEKKEYRIFSGSNLKAASDTAKVCAERTAIMSAVADNYNFIVAIVVVAKPQEDELGLHQTLRPCYECRDTLRALIVNNDIFETVVEFETILLTVNEETGDIEQMTLEELFQIYQMKWLVESAEPEKTLRQYLLEI